MTRVNYHNLIKNEDYHALKDEGVVDRINYHKRIKNEDYHAREGEGDLCYGCGLLLYNIFIIVLTF